MRKFYWIAAVTVIADQLVKWLCTRLSGSVMLIPHVLALTYAENTGMAFSLFSGRAWVLGVVSAMCILAGWLVLRRYRLGGFSRTAAMLMLGGAVGNMIDRFFRGYVVDMFEVLFTDFAIFNVADAALTVGTVLMAISLLFCPREWQDRTSTREA
ncbi:MAG: signal peptidase II [Clostridia bacterium]|nr:signal peptidase II [Clostridia bacterium]